MRIVLRDGASCNTVIYLQLNWHGDFYRWYSANGDSFTVQQGDEWGNWLNTPLACGAPHSYHWNAQWGYMFFVDLSAPNGTDPQLGLYYVHGRWYNPEVGLWLSPDEKGDYFYGGAGQDPVNKSWVTQPTAPGVGGGMPPTLLQGIVAHTLIKGWCVLTYGLDCGTEVWTGFGRADIVLWLEHEIYEIKPYTDYGIQTGPAQLAGYINDMRTRYGGNWVEGRTWKPYGFFVLPDGTAINVTTHHDIFPGIIFYYWSQPIPVYIPGRRTVLVPILQPAPVPVMPGVPIEPIPIPVYP